MEDRIVALSQTAVGSAALGLWIAAGCVFSAIWTLLGPLRMRARADAEVVGLDARTLGNPILEFVTSDGTTVRYVESLGGNLKTGQSVPIRYNPRAPHRACIATPAATYLTPAVMLAIAAVVLSATWIVVERESSIAPGDRFAVYVPLSASLQDLAACARRSCSPTTLRRRLRSHERARLAAAPLDSPLVSAQLAALQRALATVGRGDGRPPAEPIEVVGHTVSRELQELLDRGELRCRDRCGRTHTPHE
jgi:hypothetical protein